MNASHRTFRYATKRFVEILYQRKFPDHPWLTHDANNIIASYLKKTDFGLEFGSGRSTLWFAKHTAHITSIEHNGEWYSKVREMLHKSNLSNVDLLLMPNYLSNQNDTDPDLSFVQLVNSIPSNSIDYVLVDGIYRDFCALASLRLIRPGGILIIDNSDCFINIKEFSVDELTTIIGPKTPRWDLFVKNTSRWRYIWTTSGISDTIIYFKPQN